MAKKRVNGEGNIRKRKDGTEHQPDHILCLKSSQGTEADLLQSGRCLCVAEGGTQRDENPPGGAADLLPAGSQRNRSL